MATVDSHSIPLTHLWIMRERESIISCCAGANKSTDVLTLTAIAHRQGGVIENLARLQFQGEKADDPALFRFRKISNPWSIAIEQVKQIGKSGCWALESKVMHTRVGGQKGLIVGGFMHGA